MSTLAKLLVNLGLDSSDFKSGISSAMDSASKLGSVVKGAATVAVAGVAAIGAGITAAAVPGLQFNNTMEIVTAQLNAFTKNGTKSAEILAMIKQRASATPFAFEEMAKATTSLLPAAKQSGIALEELLKKAEILAASNPGEGLEGAAFSIKEALSGDFLSIVERFNLPKQRLNELKAEGVPAMEAISIAMSEMGLDADLVSNLANTASGRWSTFKDTLVGVSATATKPIFDLLSSGLATANTWLAANQPLLDKFGAILAGSVSAGIDAVVKGFTFLNDSIGPLIGYFQAVLKDGDTLNDWLGNLPTSIQPVVQALGEIVNAIMNVDFSGLITQLAPAIDSTIERFRKMAEFIFTLWEQVKTFFDNNGGDIVKTFSGWSTQVIDIVNKAMVLLNTVIITTLGFLTKFIGDHGTEIQTILSGAWEVIKNVISAALNLIQGVLTAALQVINGDWAGAWETIKSMSAAIVLNLIGIIKGGLNIIAGFFGTSLDEIVSTWQNNWNMLVAIATTLAGRLITMLLKIPGQVASIGTDIINGIRNGLSNGWGALVSYVQDLTNDLFNAAKNALGISSPSKIFLKDVGLPVAQGWLQGIQLGTPALLAGIASVANQTANKARDYVAEMAKAFTGGNLLGNATKAGSNALKGLIAGMESKVSEAVRKAKDIAQKLVDSMADKLDISSPSTVFANQIGVPIILGILQGMQEQAPNLMKWIRDDLGKKLVDVLSSAVSMARAQMDIFRTLFDLEKGAAFQPLLDATEQYNKAREDAIKLANQLFDKQAEIERQIHNPLEDRLEQTAALNALYAEQSKLFDEHAAAQRLLARLSQLQETAQQGANSQQNQLTQIANAARLLYTEAQAKAVEMAKTNASVALDWFNQRKDQITELANLERERLLSTDPNEQSMLGTQIELLKGVIALEQEQQEAFININYPGGKDALGNDQIIAIILETLRRSGYQVDINYRTA